MRLKSIVSPALLFFVLVLTTAAFAQYPIKELKLNLNENGSNFLKYTFTSQVWLRYNQNNPGTVVNGFSQPTTYDIGLRRTRMQFFGKVSDKVFLYTQFGMNNFGYNSPRKLGAFFHDVTAEYYVTPKSFHLGAGLTAWTGYSRFSSPAVASIMGVDAPLFEQSTNDVNDQFLRKLSIYAKGKIGKLDYRVILSNPFLVDSNTATVKNLGTDADFSYKAPKLQTSAYFMYQFFDQETNATAYNNGTYLGQKKVFNIGAGFEYQPKATWSKTGTDTLYHTMQHFAIDLFYDAPLNKEKGTSISCYAVFASMDFGPRYTRNLGVMNTASKTIAPASFNGAGNAFPMIGTGQVLYAQAGYLMPKKLLGEKGGQLMPYASIMHAQYIKLKSAMVMYDAGVQWLIDGHRSKLGACVQNRPVFSSTTLKEQSRKNMVVIQYQIAI